MLSRAFHFFPFFTCIKSLEEKHRRINLWFKSGKCWGADVQSHHHLSVEKKHFIFSHLNFILLCTFVIFTCKLFSSFCTRMNLFWLAANDVEWGGGSDEEGNMNSKHETWKSWLLIWFVLNNSKKSLATTPRFAVVHNIVSTFARLKSLITSNLALLLRITQKTASPAW